MNYELRQCLFLAGYSLFAVGLGYFVIMPIWTRIEIFVARWKRFKKWEKYHYGKRRNHESEN